MRQELLRDQIMFWFPKYVFMFISNTWELPLNSTAGGVASRAEVRLSGARHRPARRVWRTTSTRQAFFLFFFSFVLYRPLISKENFKNARRYADRATSFALRWCVFWWEGQCL